MMARELGFPSRLVTGFARSFDLATDMRVLPQDVHVWAEIRLEDGRWFEVEATPSYAQPQYQPSLWLRAKKFLEPTGCSSSLDLLWSSLSEDLSVWVDWVLHNIWSVRR